MSLLIKNPPSSCDLFMQIWNRTAPPAALRAPPQRGHHLQWRVLRLHQSGEHHGALQNRYITFRLNECATSGVFLQHFKAAIINIFILTMSHMTTCVWKGLFIVMNPQRIVTLQFPSVLGALVFFSSLFWFSAAMLFFDLFSAKSSKNTPYTTCTQLATSWWTLCSI